MQKDITIIGGGPTGLFGAFHAGMRGVSARIIEALPELGGQLVALYPEKCVLDVGGIPRILARDLANRLVEQGLQFGAEVCLQEEVLELTLENGVFRAATDRAEHLSRSVVIAAGKGAFMPRKLECPGYDRLLGSGVVHHVSNVAEFEGRRLLIVGGGDSAVDWALALKDCTRSLTLIHRREGFRAQAHSLRQLREAEQAGEIEVLTHREVREVFGDQQVAGAAIFDNRTGEERMLELEAVLVLTGYKPDLGPIARWGLQLQDEAVRVAGTMATNLPGVYAAGDVVTYEGKLDLIATGFAEVAIAVNQAVHFLDPSKRFKPTHSSSMKLVDGRLVPRSAGSTEGPADGCSQC